MVAIWSLALILTFNSSSSGFFTPDSKFFLFNILKVPVQVAQASNNTRTFSGVGTSPSGDNFTYSGTGNCTVGHECVYNYSDIRGIHIDTKCDGTTCISTGDFGNQTMKQSYFANVCEDSPLACQQKTNITNSASTSKTTDPIAEQHCGYLTNVKAFESCVHDYIPSINAEHKCKGLSGLDYEKCVRDYDQG
jgi:hypothetical protein